VSPSQGFTGADATGPLTAGMATAGSAGAAGVAQLGVRTIGQRSDEAEGSGAAAASGGGEERAARRPSSPALGAGEGQAVETGVLYMGAAAPSPFADPGTMWSRTMNLGYATSPVHSSTLCWGCPPSPQEGPSVSWKETLPRLWSRTMNLGTVPHPDSGPDAAPKLSSIVFCAMLPSGQSLAAVIL